eukprot:GHVL01005062.1.p1 GENE.GHVL01005062.1~~GHVL01005062.1.p1  ORF type:complete len:163 (-),score=42.38 GHVL01005062.1:262-714(-)
MTSFLDRYSIIHNDSIECKICGIYIRTCISGKESNFIQHLTEVHPSIIQKKKIEDLPYIGNNDIRHATFQFTNEGPTLGNAISWILMHQADVEYAGWAVPHPSNPEMNIRVQTIENPAIHAFENGLNELLSIFDIIKNTFNNSIYEYQNS